MSERRTALTPSATRAALVRRDFAWLKEALKQSPRSLSFLWPRLTPLERAACWRLLPASSLPAAAAKLTPAARWQAYLSASVKCLAPLLENAPKGVHKLFRAPTSREAALLRRGI